MYIIINGKNQEIGQEFENLAFLFEYLLDNVLPKNTVIDKIKLNNKWYEEFDEDYLVETSPKGYNIEIKTITLDELKANSLENAKEHLASMDERYEKVASIFRSGNEQKGNEELKKIIDTTKTLLSFLDTFCESGKEEFFQKVTDVFNELIEAQKAEDPVLIADIIEYELQELSSKMKVMFESIS